MVDIACVYADILFHSLNVIVPMDSHTCMQVCVYVCVCVCLQVRVYAFMYVEHEFVHVCVYVHLVCKI